MEEPVHQTFKIGLLLSKLNLVMSKTEAIESCKVYFEITSSENINNLLVLELKQKEKKVNLLSSIKIWLDRLALTKEAHLIIGNAHSKPELSLNINSDSPFISNLTKNKSDPSFKISTQNVSVSEGKKETFNLEYFAKLLAERGFHKTNMQSPDLEFTILNASKILLGIKIWANTDLFEKRKAHLRPVLHPTAINPRLARAMINIAGAEKEVFDPFCGAGGLLIEAARINLKAIGTDIDLSMVNRAKLNLNEEKPEHQQLINIQKMDALKWNSKVECVVTDLPYGKSSKLKDTVSLLANNFLTHYSTLTSKIVFCFPKGTELNIPQTWNIKYNFEIYIHKSLTRHIISLEKKQPL